MALKDLIITTVRRLWRAVDLARRAAMNLAFLLLVALLLAWLFSGGGTEVEDGVALVLAPRGALVEQLDGNRAQRKVREALGRATPETLVQDLLDAIAQAKGDDRIQALYLDLDRMGGAGLPKLQLLAAALEDFKESGKPVVAGADSYGQGAYFLASFADEVHLHEQGGVFLEGYGSYRNYYREALDKIDAEWHVFRVGEYKSAVEPYLRNDMSPEARESRLTWLSQLWAGYRDGVAAARGIDPEEVERYTVGLHERLREQGGSASQAALAAGLVDRVGGRDQLRDRLIELVGEDRQTHSFRAIGFETYLEAVGRPGRSGRQQVAVLVAKGVIGDGSRPPGSIGGDSTARLIRAARLDDDVEALVLRVDSPGGSAFASEVIRREIELVRQAGKPVVASMGSVAASGGYWISMSSDEIWAQPTTITGSIGIYTMFPTFDRSLARLGIHTDGVATSWAAGLASDRPLPEEAREAIRLGIEEGYQQFITKAAEGRGRTPEEIDAVGRGRVWSGADAHRLGLVDHLGGLEDAIAAAAERAGLGERYGVRLIEQEESFADQILAGLLARAVRWTGFDPGRSSPLEQLPALERVAADLALLEEIRDPFGRYAYCFCEIE